MRCFVLKRYYGIFDSKKSFERFGFYKIFLYLCSSCAPLEIRLIVLLIVQLMVALLMNLVLIIFNKKYYGEKTGETKKYGRKPLAIG